MPTDQDERKAAKQSPEQREQANEQAKNAPTGDGESTTANAEDTSFVNSDKFQNPAVKALAAYQTAEDEQGIERIVSTTPQGWSPAPLTASDEEIKAAEQREANQKEAKQLRLNALQGKVENSDRATNDQGQGGSQEPPAA